MSYNKYVIAVHVYNLKLSKYAYIRDALSKIEGRKKSLDSNASKYHSVMKVFHNVTVC